MTKQPPPRSADVIHFKTVPVRRRHDGWTPERQFLFIQALSRIGIVRTAAASVGKSAKSAYRLRERPGAESFRRAWDLALDMGQGMVLDCAIERAIDGVEEPVFYRGKQIGMRRRYDTMLLQTALNTMIRTKEQRRRL